MAKKSTSKIKVTTTPKNKNTPNRRDILRILSLLSTNATSREIQAEDAARIKYQKADENYDTLQEKFEAGKEATRLRKIRDTCYKKWILDKTKDGKDRRNAVRQIEVNLRLNGVTPEVTRLVKALVKKYGTNVKTDSD